MAFSLVIRLTQQINVCIKMSSASKEMSSAKIMYGSPCRLLEEF